MGTRNTKITLAGVVSAFALAASALCALPAQAAEVSVQRVAGVDRYDTSAKLSAQTFPAEVGVLYVTSGQDYPDALAAGAVAGLKKAPLLLVKKNEIPASIAAEITRLKPAEIIIVGGEGTIASEVHDALETLSPKVSRVAGANRYETAALLSQQNYGIDTSYAYVASGTSFPDALTASSAAAAAGGPVLLTPRVGLPDVTGDELERMDPRHIVVVGGTAAIADSTAAEAFEFRVEYASRAWGPDRYDTAATVGRTVLNSTRDTVYLASGANYPDALAGVPAAATVGAPVFIVPPTGTSDRICTEVRRLQPTKLVVLGGTGAIADGVADAMAACAGMSPLVPNAPGGQFAGPELPGNPPAPPAPAPVPEPSVPAPGPVPSGDTPPAKGSVTCDLFRTQTEAQAYYDYWLARGYGDYFGLDSDGGGVACKSLLYR